MIEGWPCFLATILIGSAVAWLSIKYEWCRILIPISFGIALGPRVFRLREKFPTAKHLWLLSIGMMTCLIGVAARMAFPAWQGTAFDLSWLGVAFVSILAFVLINRGNKDVVQ